MNDPILSGLLNLFALFGAITGKDEAQSRKVVSDYLTRYFGIRGQEDYIGLYDDLCMVYSVNPNLDKDSIITQICTSLQGAMMKDEQALLLLRLMEFCNMGNKGELDATSKEIFDKIAETFQVPADIYADFISYIRGKENDHVLIYHSEGLDGYIKVLNLKLFNKTIFTYCGADTLYMNDVPLLPDIFMIWQHSGVLKSAKSKAIYHSMVATAFKKCNQKDDSRTATIELAGRGMEFRFPNSNNGIHNFTFTLHGGELVAIMGGSGVGKSTLLSLLNGSLQPTEGTITLNGYNISDPKVKDLIGFVPQDDLLIEELTVYQNLWYTARLCFDKLSDKELDAKVLEVLSDLELLPQKDLKVGGAINKFISGGQRKRLNIALELIREPAVLFLDEPTSGLSSADSEKVINLLKEQTFKGRLIVVNIHQPSSDIYQLFDRLWLLDRGGYPVYDGNPIEAVVYFKEAANYADAQTSMCPTCGNVNPEIVLNIIDAKMIDNTSQLTNKRKVSPETWHNLYVSRRPEANPVQQLEVPASRQRKPSALKQLGIFLQRNLTTKITNLQYVLISLLEAPLLALIVALLTRYAPAEGYSIMDNKNLVSYMFMAVIVVTFIGMSGSAEEIFKDKALLKREKFLRLSHGSYIASKIIFMSALSVVQTLLFLFVGNLVMGIDFLFFDWWLILLLSALVANLTGLLLSQLMSSLVAIYITIPLLLIPQILLCGLVVRFDDLTPNSRTGNVPFIGQLVPSRWAFEALAVDNFTSNPYEVNFFELDRVKYSNLYYERVFTDKLQGCLEYANKELADSGRVVNPEHLAMLRTELPHLSELSGQQPFARMSELADASFNADTYAALDVYLREAAELFAELNRQATQKKDAIITRMQQEMGKEEYLEMKRSSHNNYLADLVANTLTTQPFHVTDHHIVPEIAQIYLPPISKNGNAPFYSSVKCVGDTEIPTYWYNVGVLLFMLILAGGLLFFDLSRYQKASGF